MATVKPLLTAEEYARLPDPDNGTKDELIEGEVVYRPLPGMLHGEVCGSACCLLGNYADQRGGVTTVGSGVIVSRNPDSVLGPDVSYWSKRPPQWQDWPDTPPDAVFEIADYNEPYHHLHRKILLYRRFGVGVLWVVAPLCDSVTEYRGQSIQLLGLDDCLDGGDELPGFSCQVADLFV